MNRAAAWLTQKLQAKDNTDPAKSYPLVDIPDMVSKLKDGTVTINDLVDRELSEQERTALDAFVKAAQTWADHIRANFVKGSIATATKKKVHEDYLYRDPMQDFINEDGTVDENLVTAIAYGAFNWYTEHSGTRYQTHKSVLNMLGIKDSPELLRYGAYSQLKHATSLESKAITSMGRDVMNALGLTVSKEAVQNYGPNLIDAFGIHAMQALVDAGLVRQFSIKQNKLYTSSTEEDKKSPSMAFLAIARDSVTGEIPKAGKPFAGSQKGAGNVLGEAMEVDKEPVMATLEEVPFVQKKPKRSQRSLPKALADILAAQQKIPYTESTSMWDLAKLFGKEFILTSAGKVDLQTEKVHVDQREAIEAQNQNLEQQLNLASDLVNAHPQGTPFYIAFEVWKNLRVGIKTKNLNPQSSKIHRYMFQREDWVSKIDMNNADHLRLLEMSLAQALGIKIDSMSGKDARSELSKILDNSETRIKEYAQAIYQASINKTDIDAGLKQEIARFSRDKEGMQTLQALVTLGQYLHAQGTGAESFETTMLVGIDGKTNGPMLTLLALGAGATVDALYNLLNRGGFYRAKDGVANFNVWKSEPANQDLYESTG